MRADLGWSYFTAGAMNTVNAAGYLVGALLVPRALRRFDARTLLLAGGAVAALLLPAHGAVRGDAAALPAARADRRGQRGQLRRRRPAGRAAGAARAGVRAGAGARHLLRRHRHRHRRLGALVGAAALDGARPCAALAVGLVRARRRGAAATAFTAAFTRGLGGAAAGRGAASALRLARASRPALAGYMMFGLGYIGYMTFIVTLLREQGLGGARGERLLRAARCRRDGLVVAVGRAAAALSRRRAAGAAERAARAGHAAAGAERRSRSSVFASGAAVRRRLPLAGGVDHRARAPQPAAGGLAGAASPPSRSSSPPGRSSARAWSAGSPTAPAAWQRGFVLSAAALALGALLAAASGRWRRR